MRVVVDETGVTRPFDYLVPADLADRVRVGTRVRVALGPRRAGAWIVAVDVEPPAGVPLRPIAKVTGEGPDADLVDLAEWARWRWAAKTVVPFLRTASPERATPALPPPAVRDHPVPAPADPVLVDALAGGTAVLRTPPTADPLPLAQAASALGPALVLCPSRDQARSLAVRLRRAGVPTALHPEQWDRAAAGGCTVVGARAAAWAPVPGLAAVVVLDEHDEVHQEERSPTWHARDVAVERARRAGVPCVLATPTPSLEALDLGRLVRVDRAAERAGWPAVVVVDRTEEDVGRNALFSPALVDVVRSGARVVSVLNTKGRAALLACGSCRAVARCADCGGAVRLPTRGSEEVPRLTCRRCGRTRPVICAGCGATDLRTIRMGVSRVADDLAALAGEPVVEVTGDDAHDPAARRRADGARLLVGTEAVLHRVERADVVAFLDLDAELLAPRYRAAEEALALLVRAGRIVGGRRDGGRVLVQTRLPDHEVVRAAVLGDPARWSDVEAARRADLGLPPAVALAEVGDAAGEAFAEALRTVVADAASPVRVRGPLEGTWRVEAPDHASLCDALAATARPPGRLRLAVDPPRL